MTDAAERLVNLALFLAASGPVSAERIRTEVAGYPEGQDEAAFLRMFERDKDELRAMGLAIDTDPRGAYRLDTSRTFVTGLDLSHDEETVLRAIAAVYLDDASFPFRDDLRYALAKIAGGSESEVPAAAHLADERPETQGVSVGLLATAAASRKRVAFGYTNAAGAAAAHTVEPFGLFLHSGRWYLVGRDTVKCDTRVYAVSRMDEVSVEPSRPKSPDFEPPADFDVTAYIGLPFQYGQGEEFDAAVRFSPSVAWRAPALTGGVGELRLEEDELVWHVTARDPVVLARWVVANGPGLTVESPPEVRAVMESGLSAVVDRHA